MTLTRLLPCTLALAWLMSGVAAPAQQCRQHCSVHAGRGAGDFEPLSGCQSVLELYFKQWLTGPI